MMVYSNEEVLEVFLNDLNHDGEMLFHHQVNEVIAEINHFCRGCKQFFLNKIWVNSDNVNFGIEHDSINNLQFTITYDRDGYEYPQVEFIPMDINTRIEIRRRNDNVITVII